MYAYVYNGWPSLTIINPHFTASSTILNHTQPPVGPPKNVDLSKQIMGLLIYLAHTWNQQAEHWHFKSNISDFKTKEIGRHPPVFFLDWQWQIPFQWKLIYDNININGNNVPLTFAQVSSNILHMNIINEFIIHYWLVVSTPLKNMKVSWDYYSR